MMWCLIIANGVCIGDPVKYTDKVRSGKGVEVVVNEDKDMLIGMMKYYKVPQKEVPSNVVDALKRLVVEDKLHLARPLLTKYYPGQVGTCCDSVMEKFINEL